MPDRFTRHCRTAGFTTSFTTRSRCFVEYILVICIYLICHWIRRTLWIIPPFVYFVYLNVCLFWFSICYIISTQFLRSVMLSVALVELSYFLCNLVLSYLYRLVIYVRSWLNWNKIKRNTQGHTAPLLCHDWLLNCPYFLSLKGHSRDDVFGIQNRWCKIKRSSESMNERASVCQCFAVFSKVLLWNTCCGIRKEVLAK